MIHRLVILFTLILALLPTRGIGEEAQKLSSELPSESVEAVLVLDSSGSMRLTDPKKLRDEGTKLFTQFLKQGDKLAIVAFADTARVLRPLSEYDPAQQSAVQSSIEQVGQDGIYTDLLSGVEAAAKILRESTSHDGMRVVVLLSDGKMEPAQQFGTADSRTDVLLNELLPELKAEGIKVHTLYFSEMADQGLLRQIAVATEGVNLFAATAETIHQAFADLFLAVKKPQVLPLTSKGFKIDGDVEEATFYISRDGSGDISIRSPTGVVYNAGAVAPNLKWFSGQKFEVVTIHAPEVGDWVIDGVAQNDGFATVLTNLKLASDFPATIFSGSEALIQARLFEAEKPVVLPRMSGSIAFGFRISPTDRIAEPIEKDFLVDDGTNGDLVANDGVFSRKVTVFEEGEYKLVVIARAPTFERSQQISFRVRPRMVSLSITKEAVQPPAQAGEDAHGKEHAGEHKEESPTGDSPKFLITLSEEASQLQKINLKLIAVDAERRKLILPTSKADTRGLRYTAPVALLPAPGPYELQAQLTGEAKRGKPVKEESLPLHYTHEVHGEAPEVAIVLEEPAQEEEQPEPSIFPYLLGMTLLILLGAGAAFLHAKKSSAQGASVVPEAEAIDDVLEALKKLEEIAQKTTIDADDPLIVDESIQLQIRKGDSPAISGAVTSAGAAAAEGQPAAQAQGAAAPEGEAVPQPQEEKPAEGESGASS
ncbi:MAG: VWA domain-containing protein [Bdellovibrionota bacterium]|nr:MAG: VWA domain-containing protein [Bdellovibrionota bacterium]